METNLYYEMNQKPIKTNKQTKHVAFVFYFS